jgi:iron complex outermembrane receptor protein
MSSVVPGDIDRVEVISGPGATMWGANAVNGIINVITKASSETLGGVADMGGGDQQRRATLRYGGKINDALTGRIYALGFRDEDTVNAAGLDAGDAWSNKQVGFRLDLAPASGTLTSLQGDAYHGAEDRSQASDEIISGHNLLARWTRTGNHGAELRIQTYYDQVERNSGDSGRFRVETWDLDLQHSLQLGRHEVVLGGGYRAHRYRITGTAGFSFDPAAQDLSLVNVFLQDSIALGKRFNVTAGLKIEDQYYADPAVLPTLRVDWKASDRINTWAAASRSVRSATPFDQDVVEKLGATTFLIGNNEFKSEKLIAYEAGLRIEPQPNIKLSAAAFYNDYSDLRTIEINPAGFLPLRWGNQMYGHTYGVDLWAEYQVTNRWRVAAAYSNLNERLKFESTSSQLLGIKQAGNDPKHQASLKSSWQLLNAMTLDAALRYVSALPDPHVPSYVELNSRLAWRIKQSLELSVAGWNLLHSKHREYAGDEANLVPRSVFMNLQWTF